LIRSYFFVLLGIMCLAAWQIARLWHKGDLAQAGKAE
jgi:cytochrome oxidase assembly protein ShyY1